MASGLVASHREITAVTAAKRLSMAVAASCLGGPGPDGGGSGVCCSAATMSLRKLCSGTTDSPPFRPRTPLVVGKLAVEVVGCRYADVRTDMPALMTVGYVLRTAARAPHRRRGMPAPRSVRREPDEHSRGVRSRGEQG